MTSPVLPPWGHMEVFFQELLENPGIPKAWIAQNPAQVEREYQDFFEDLLKDLTTLLWPEFDKEAGDWKSPVPHALNLADLDLMDALKVNLTLPIKGGGKEPPTHEVMFHEEDDEDVLFGTNYQRYDPGLPRHLAYDMKEILWTGCSRKLGALHIQLKDKLQRPRAHQVALILKRPLAWIFPLTGGTPAMISGHCVQGSLGGCSAFLLFGSLDAVSQGYLQQLTVDIGDRRVFAGVHYPSDNLASWYTTLKLLPHVVEARDLPRVRAFFRGALENKSIVYDAIRTHVANHGPSPFEPAYTALQALW